MVKKLKPGPGRASKDHPTLAECEIISKGGKGDKQRKMPRALAVWLDRAKSLGLQNKQLVWELHVIQGHSKAETARLLQITPGRVWQLYDENKRELLERSPKSPEDFEAMREELKDRLLSVYEAACKDASDPRMLAIRLKTLDQLSKLHGLNLETPAPEKESGGQYATPEELQDAVRARMLEIHGRAVDVAAVRDALALPRSEGDDSGTADESA